MNCVQYSSNKNASDKTMRCRREEAEVNLAVICYNKTAVTFVPENG